MVPRIASDELGTGEPTFLCLPGWCIERSLYAEVLPLLAEHGRSIAIDWRGHGGSEATTADFGESELVEDALEVIESSGARSIIPIAQAHAGWVALELSRRLGARIPAMVLVSWAVGEPPPALAGALSALQDPGRSQSAREQLIASWLSGATEALRAKISGSIGAHGFDMWARAGRVIAEAYRRDQSPLAVLGRLTSPPRILHLYAQPTAPAFLAMQEEFTRSHHWFSVRRLEGKTHFPMLELPRGFVGEIASFLTRSSVGS